MGITPIERLKAWLASLSRRCNFCRADGQTFLSKGGYRYCTPECEAADALAQQEALL